MTANYCYKFMREFLENENMKINFFKKMRNFIQETIRNSINEIRPLEENYSNNAYRELIGLRLDYYQCRLLERYFKLDLSLKNPVEISLKGNFGTRDRKLCTTIIYFDAGTL